MIPNLLFLALTFVLAAIPANAEETSPWSVVDSAAVRLIAGDPVTPVIRKAGVEIRLEEGWKTYWRTPGDAGIPPIFNWSGSQNVAGVTVLWPAPHRFVDGGGTSIGYKSDVIFPVHVEAIDPAKPVELKLAIDFALCKDICVPAKGEATLLLPPDRPGREMAALVAAHEARVPKASQIGATEPLAIASVSVVNKTSPPQLWIDVAGPKDAELFAEGPKGWYLAVPKPIDGAPAGRQRFLLPLDGQPKDTPTSGVPLLFTLVSQDRAIEAAFTLP